MKFIILVHAPLVGGDWRSLRLKKLSCFSVGFISSSLSNEQVYYKIFLKSMPKKSTHKKLKMPTKFSDEPKGLVICYIGAGKGKTTAAMGMAVRAAGSGKNVFILQFVKAAGKSSADIKEGEWPVSSEIEFFDNV